MGARLRYADGPGDVQAGVEPANRDAATAFGGHVVAPPEAAVDVSFRELGIAARLRRSRASSNGGIEVERVLRGRRGSCSTRFCSREGSRRAAVCRSRGRGARQRLCVARQLFAVRE